MAHLGGTAYCVAATTATAATAAAILTVVIPALLWQMFQR
jgi:hypothetical protein